MNHDRPRRLKPKSPPFVRRVSALTTRHDEAQGREITLRVITHNLMLLAEAP